MLLCHGLGGGKTEAHFLFVKTARALATAGFAVFRYDSRGASESGGTFASMTVGRLIADAKAALHHLAKQPGVDHGRLGLLGLSLGGCVASHVAAREPRVRSLALWSAVGDPRRWLTAARKAFGPLPRTRTGGVDLGGHELRRSFFTTAPRWNPLTALRNCRRRFPVLVVHGTADRAVPVSTAAHYFTTLERAGYPARKLLLAGYDHTFSTVEREASVIAATVEWFRRTL